MIKIALKHYIYDMCLNMFFSNIHKNFVLPDKLKGLVLGNEYKIIVFKGNVTPIINYKFIFYTAIVKNTLYDKLYLSIKYNTLRIYTNSPNVLPDVSFFNINEKGENIYTKLARNGTTQARIEHLDHYIES